jgi:hypothetical protein
MVAARIRNAFDVPLRSLKRSVWWLRKTFFSRPPTPAPALVVDRSVAETTRLLGERYFEPGWEFSYHYHDEVLNLRRVEYRDRSPYVWWQTHVRGYERDDGLVLAAHVETEPTEHPDAHLAAVGLDTDAGTAALAAVLDDAGVDYREGRVGG